MPINRILQTQPDIQIAIRQLDDELTALKSQLTSVQNKINQLKSGIISNGSNGSSGSGIGVSFNGDLTGSNVSQTVVGLQNKPIDSTIPTTGQILEYNGTKWIPANLSAIPGSVTFAGDLSGTNTSQSVTGISGKPLDTAAEAIGQLIQYDGTKWAYRTSPIINNNNAIQFLEPTNTFSTHQYICGPGGNCNFQYRPNTGTAFANAYNCDPNGNIAFGVGNFSVTGPVVFGNTLLVTGNAIFSSNLSIAGGLYVNTITPYSGAFFNFAGDLRALNGHHFEAYSPDNTKIAYFYCDASGNMQVLSTSGFQVFQSIQATNISASTRLQITGGTSDITLFSAGGTSYMQLFPPGNAAIGTNPGFYSSTGTIRFLSTNIQCDAGTVSAVGLTVTNPVSITFGSNWVAWTPTYNTGTMTMTSIVYNRNWYLRIGPIVFFELSINCTLGGTVTGQILASLPVAVAGADFIPCFCSGTVGSGATYAVALGYVSGSNIQINLTGNANFTAGTNVIRISGHYRCV